MGQAQYQYTLQGEDLAEMNQWAPQLLQKMRSLPQLRDVNTDQQDKGLQAAWSIDRDTARVLELPPRISIALCTDAFGQRQVSIMYKPLNQYHVSWKLLRSLPTAPTLFRVSMCGRRTARRCRCVDAHFGLRTPRSRSTTRDSIVGDHFF